MSHEDFMELVARLRAAQKKCRTHRRLEYLERALELEREVDRVLKAYTQASCQGA
jgi:hypothetical protein